MFGFSSLGTFNPGDFISYTAKQLKGNGLEQLGYLSESALTTRRFRNRIKSLGIFRPCYRDKAVLVHGPVQWRFQPGISNSSFKYEHFRQGGSLGELRTFPKRPYRPVVGYRDQTRKGTFSRAHKTLPGAGVWKPRRRGGKRQRGRAKLGGNGPSQSSPIRETKPEVWKPKQWLSRRTAGRLVRAARVESNGEFISIVGGQVFPFKPHVGHSKYWYFNRKNRSWFISRHHPVGDEIEHYRVLQTKRGLAVQARDVVPPDKVTSGDIKESSPLGIHASV